MLDRASLDIAPTATGSTIGARARALLRAAHARLGRPSIGALACLAITAFYLARFFTFTGWRIGADGFYSWMFARSLAFDHDIHFANDYAICGDPWREGVDLGGGRPANPFYLGPGLVWAPMLALVRHVVTLPANASAAWRAGCDGPWAIDTLSLAPLFGGATLWMGHRLARRWCSDAASTAAVVVVGLCSPLPHFAALIACYSHVWSAFAVGLATLTFVRAVEAPRSLARWFLAGAAVGVAALMRMQSAILLLSPAIVLLVDLIAEARARRFPGRPIVAGLVTLAGFASLAWVQLAAWKVLYGAYWVVPYGHSYLLLGHGHPFYVLFGGRSGLLSWHPLMWLGLVGTAVMLVRRDLRLVALALLVPTAFDLYLGSAATWHAGSSFGARRLCTLATPFVATTALCLTALWRWLNRRPWRVAAFAALGWVLPWALINQGASDGNVDGRIASDRAVPMPQLYGDGLRIGLDAVYAKVGNPLVLPASLVFALRYGVQPRRFDDFSTGGMFTHDYRSLAIGGPDTIDFTDAASDRLLVEGVTRGPDGATIAARQRGRFLVELDWPFVTHVELDVRPRGAHPARVALTVGGFWSRRLAATFDVRAPGVQTIAVPSDAFDSGVNEVIIDTDADVTIRRWRWIDRGYHNTSIR